MKRIIICMPNFIGDSINTIPAIELVRQVFPQARITLLGPSFLKELFEYDPRISYIIVSNKRKKNYFRNIFVILRNRYDLGILFTNTFMTALLLRLALVKRLVGYENEGRNVRGIVMFTILIDMQCLLMNGWEISSLVYLP